MAWGGDEMNHDKLAIRRGLVYEGDISSLHAIHPIPVITNASGDLVRNQSSPAQEVVFREDSFDPVTRIRRGRFYQTGGQQTWHPDRVHNYPFGPHIGLAGGAFDFDNHYTAIDHTNPGIGTNGAHIYLGSDNYKTAWRVVDIEKISTGHLLFTLKSLSSFGVLPKLEKDDIEIKSAYENVVDAALKYDPIPLIDVCKSAANVVLLAWLPTVGVVIGKNQHELGQLADFIPPGKDKERIAPVAKLLARLHSHSKPSVQKSQVAKNEPLRSVTDDDAELAIQLFGFLLKEIGWAL